MLTFFFLWWIFKGASSLLRCKPRQDLSSLMSFSGILSKYIPSFQMGKKYSSLPPFSKKKPPSLPALKRLWFHAKDEREYSISRDETQKNVGSPCHARADAEAEAWESARIPLHRSLVEPWRINAGDTLFPSLFPAAIVWRLQQNNANVLLGVREVVYLVVVLVRHRPMLLHLYS